MVNTLSLALNTPELSPDSPEFRINSKLLRDMGDVMRGAMDDPLTIEVILNPDGSLWQEKLGGDLEQVGVLEEWRGRSIIETVAGALGKVVTHKNPLLEGEFPVDGSRFAGQIPPIVHAPSFAIRKKASSIFTLNQYVESGTMTPEQRALIGDAVKNHKNVLVVGGTGSGKTTLTNAIIFEMVEQFPSERFTIIEDTGEIQCAAKNYIALHTTLEVSMTDLLKTTLRIRPDRIIVGEVRGVEALDLLMAWNTGHDGGVATLHANNSISALSRLLMLISMNPNAPRPIEPLVGEAVHLIVHIEKDSQGRRRVASIAELEGYVDGEYKINVL